MRLNHTLTVPPGKTLQITDSGFDKLVDRYDAEANRFYPNLAVFLLDQMVLPLGGAIDYKGALSLILNGNQLSLSAAEGLTLQFKESRIVTNLKDLGQPLIDDRTFEISTASILIYGFTDDELRNLDAAFSQGYSAVLKSALNFMEKTCPNLVFNWNFVMNSPRLQAIEVQGRTQGLQIVTQSKMTLSLAITNVGAFLIQIIAESKGLSQALSEGDAEAMKLLIFKAALKFSVGQFAKFDEPNQFLNLLRKKGNLSVIIENDYFQRALKEIKSNDKLQKRLKEIFALPLESYPPNVETLEPPIKYIVSRIEGFSSEELQGLSPIRNALKDILSYMQKEVPMKFAMKESGH